MFKKITWAGTVTSDEDATIDDISQLKIGDIVVIKGTKNAMFPCILDELNGESVCILLTYFKRETIYLEAENELLRKYNVYKGKLNKDRRITEHDIWLAGLSFIISFFIPYGQYTLVRAAVRLSALALYIKSNIWRD